MRSVLSWFSKLAGIFSAHRAEQSFDEELQSHLELHIADNLRRGMTPEEARRVALLKLGGRDATKEAYRDQRRLPIVGTFLQDARFALRTMRRSPGLTAVAVLTLALGIGVNTAMFSIVYGVLLAPLPYHDPDALMSVYSSSPRRGYTAGPTSPPDFREMRDRNRTLASLSAYFNSAVNLSGDFQAERLSGLVVSTEFFDTLGVRPLLGRTFRTSEGVWGSHRAVVLSESFWRSRFAARPDILGAVLRLDGESWTVIGVMPASFYFRGEYQLWQPMAFRPGDVMDSHNNAFVRMVGRRKPGASRQQARTDLNAIMQDIAARHSENKGIGAGLMPLLEQVVGDVRRPLWVLLAAVGFVLLICCVNLSSLLLSRDAARKREFALRAALGASRGRLLRQFLTENLLLALLGGGASLGLAYLAVAKAHTLVVGVPRIQHVTVNTAVLLFALAASIGAGVLSGLLPCLWSSRPDLMGALREGRSASSNSRGGARLRGVLILTEVALAFVLTIAAGLMMQSFSRLLHVNSGFDPHNVLTFSVSLPDSYIEGVKASDITPPPRLTAFYDGLVARIARLPGVASVGVTSGLPLAGGNWIKFLSFDDRPAPASIDAVARVLFHSTEGDFFRAMGITLRKGRFFEAGDNVAAAPVVILNAAAARRYYPGEDPIGKLVFLAPPEQLLPPGELPAGFHIPRARIVGIVNDVHYEGLQDPPDPEVYAPLAQSDFFSTMSVAVRTLVPSTSLIPAIRAEVSDMDRELPIAKVATMDELAGSSVALPRLHTILLAIFGALALGLAAVGLYGVIAQSVAQRRHEVGVRIALGARPRAIVWGIVARAMTLVAAGLLIGCGLALALTRLMSTLLFEVAPVDAPTFVGSAGLLLATSALASYLPARRAASVDPIVALRCE